MTYHRHDGSSDMGVLQPAQAYVNQVPAPHYRVPPGMQLVPIQPMGSAVVEQRQAFGLKQLLIAVVVVVAILVLMYWLDKLSRAPERPVRPNTRKQSTSEMARNLYKRLEKRGGVADTTMRSLKQLGRR